MQRVLAQGRSATHPTTIRPTVLERPITAITMLVTSRSFSSVVCFSLVSHDFADSSSFIGRKKYGMKKPGINKTIRLDIPLVTEVTLYRSEDWEERASFVIIGKKKYEIETFIKNMHSFKIGDNSIIKDRLICYCRKVCWRDLFMLGQSLITIYLHPKLYTSAMKVNHKTEQPFSIFKLIL